MVEELVSKARQGDQEAFTALFNRYKSIVYGVCYSICGKKLPNEIDDIVNSTFAKAFLRIDSFRGDSAFASWIYTIARTEALMALRKERRLEQYRISEAVEDIDHDEETKFKYLISFTDKEYKRIEAIEDINKIFDMLPLKFKRYLSLYYIEGHSMLEICEILNKSLPSVNSWIHRSVKKARELVSQLN